MSYFAVKEGNFTLKVYNIPINFKLFNNLKKFFTIEPPDHPSVYNILNAFNKPTYSSYTPSREAYKLGHLTLTAIFTFLTTFFCLLSGNVSILCILCAVFR